MEQQNIRPWNNQQYSKEEGAAIVQELDLRTTHNDEEYNSMALLGAKVKSLRQFVSLAEMKTATNIAMGSYLITKSYYVDDNRGGAIYRRVDPTGLTPNDMDIVLAENGNVFKLSEPERVNPYMFGTLQNDEATTPNLQAFFDYVEVNDVVGDWRGDWSIDNSIQIKGTEKEFYCGSIHAIGTNFNNASTKGVVSVETSRSIYHNTLEITGNDTASYASRYIDRALTFENSGGRNTFHCVDIKGFREWGIYQYAKGADSTILDSIFRIRASDVGSAGSTYPNGSLSMVINSITNSGLANSTGQRSNINLSAEVNNSLSLNSLLEIAGEIHIITALPGGNAIEVYPWVDDTFTGTIYSIDGGVLIAGANSASSAIQDVDLKRCGSMRVGGLYGSLIGHLQTQLCGAGLVIGFDNGGSSVGTQIDALYCEANTFDYVQLTRVNTGTLVHSTVSDLSKYFVVDAVTDAGTRVKGKANFHHTTLFKNSHPYTRKDTERQFNDINTGSSVNLSNDVQNNKITLLKNSPTFKLKWEEEINKVFGKDLISVKVFGTGTNKQPTGTITFNLDSTDQSAGITVMGGTTYAITNLTKPAIIACFYDYDNTNWIIINYGEQASIFETLEISHPTTAELLISRNDTAVLDGDTLGRILFAGNDASLIDTDYVSAAIRASATGSWGSGNLAKANLHFETRKDELEALQTRMTITWEGLIEYAATAIPAYNDDTAAGSGGLTIGQMYQTTGLGAAPLNVAGILMVKQ